MTNKIFIYNKLNIGLILLYISLFLPMNHCFAGTNNNKVNIKIIATTDIHGCFFPYDFIEGKEINGSLARISSYVKKIREVIPDGVVLLDNGDILQGQPINYYYNYISTEKENIASQCLNYMRYDAYTCGNHDIEPGASCYTKFFDSLNCPVLGANVIDTITQKPYLSPYTIIERQGVRIAIMGLVTPAIPHWLMPEKWKGLQFAEMAASARLWMKYIKTHENPDIVIGLFHSGLNGGISLPNCKENLCEEIAQMVDGFDAILYGHDHRPVSETIINKAGNTVLLLNAGNAAKRISEVTITVGEAKKFNVSGKLIDITKELPDKDFMSYFNSQIEEVKMWAGQKIGYIANTISTQDCFFGPSAFTDLIHNLQLQITKADVSIAAPLTFNAELKEGDINVADMFKLYKYENTLCVISMTGKEIKKHLEMSYAKWVNTMTSEEDHILLFNSETNSRHERAVLKNMYFDFDSAAGIDYIVDVRKAIGERVKILRMSNGDAFDEDKTYHVAMNSYRANGGGQLLTQGAGIPKDSLKSRIILQTTLDQRYYLMKEIERMQSINPHPNNNWHFVPTQWVKKAIRKDKAMLFGN